MTTQTAITSLAFTSLVVGASVSAGTLLDKEINDGSAPMYSQVTHTGNVVFINASKRSSFLVAAVRSKENHHVVLFTIHHWVLCISVILQTWLNLAKVRGSGASSAV